MAPKAIIGVVLLALPAWAVVSVGEEPPATAPARAAAPAVGDDLNSALEMTEAEQLAQQKRGAQLRFAAERMEAAVEIKGDLLYLKKDVDAAVAILEDSPADTPQDNIERIIIRGAVLAFELNVIGCVHVHPPPRGAPALPAAIPGPSRALARVVVSRRSGPSCGSLTTALIPVMR